MQKIKTALKAAFPHTVPILTAFLFLGAAYGILMEANGFSPLVTVCMSVFVFAGSMQFVAAVLFTAAFNPLYAFFMALMVNARHIFYGISMLEKYKDMGKFRPFLIFGLCDETFSVMCSAKPPENTDKRLFAFFVTLLNYLYWIAGSLLGALAGKQISFNTEGIDFALTALFVVIFMNQWAESEKHFSAIAGLSASAVCLLLFGAQKFIIPAMLGILLLLTIAYFAERRKELAAHE